MSRNGHNGEGLPGSLAAFMLSHLMMPPPVDRLPDELVPLSEVAHLIDGPIEPVVIIEREPSPPASRLRRLRRRMMVMRRRLRAARRSYDARTTIVEKSYDGPPKSVTELIDRLQGEGASPQLVLHTASLLAEKSYDARTTIVRCEPYEAKKAYDRDYQKKRRAALKAAKKEAEKIVRQNDATKSVPISISSTLPFLEEDTVKKESKSSGIRARVKRQAYRISEDWQPTEADLATARKYLPADRIPIEATKFKNYWLGRGDRKAVSTNWSLNWENWCVNALEYGGRNVRSGAGVPYANGAPRKENGAERSLRLAREATARKSGAGLSGSGERVVDLDSSEWTTSPFPRANGQGTGNL